MKLEILIENHLYNSNNLMEQCVHAAAIWHDGKKWEAKEGLGAAVSTSADRSK